MELPLAAHARARLRSSDAYYRARENDMKVGSIFAIDLGVRGVPQVPYSG
jgi:hypothetical protein